MVCLTCNTCTCTSPIPTSTEVDDWDRNTYLGSADRRWGKVICVQQLSWQSKTPISILLLIYAMSALPKIPGNFIGTIIRPQIQGVHSNSGATRPSVLSPSNIPLTDVIYFAVSTFYLLFHCQNEKKKKQSEEKWKERTEKVPKKKRREKGLKQQHLVSHRTFQSLYSKSASVKCFRLKCQCLCSTGPRSMGLEVFFHRFLISTRSSPRMAASHAS